MEIHFVGHGKVMEGKSLLKKSGRPGTCTQVEVACQSVENDVVIYV